MCGRSHTATHLAIDDLLLDEALKAGGHKTKKDTVTEALREYSSDASNWVSWSVWNVEFDSKCDHKRQRRRV